MGFHPSNVQILDSENALIEAGIKIWMEAFQKAVRRKVFFATALSGGKTPLPLYQKLSVNLRPEVWEQTHLFLADERFVPVGHPDSNIAMINEALIQPGHVPSQNVHPIPVHKESPEAAAREYDEHLRTFFKAQPGEAPVFDLILLGIGEDGHTASLFPENQALEERQKLAVPVKVADFRHDRVTLTLPVLNRAVKVVFLVTGERKAEIVRRVVLEKDLRLPASRVQPASGDLIFLLDREAGAQLERAGEGGAP